MMFRSFVRKDYNIFIVDIYITRLSQDFLSLKIVQYIDNKILQKFALPKASGNDIIS